MEQKLTYNQVLPLLEAKTHFAVCLFSVYGRDDIVRKQFLSSMKLRMYLVDNYKYLEEMFVCTSNPPYVATPVDLDSVQDSFSQLGLFECPLCHE